MQIVRRNQRNVKVLGQTQKIHHGALFDIDAVIHDFDKIIVATQNIAHFCGSLQGQIVFAATNAGLYLATGAACGGNQPTTQLGQNFAVQSRFLIVTLEVTCR